MRRKAEITLGSGFSAKAAGRKTNEPKGRRNATRAVAAIQTLREPKTPLSEHPALRLVSIEPGKARISFNETVSVATALSILDLLQKDRAGAE